MLIPVLVPYSLCALSAGGLEIIYDALGHLLGKASKFNGVAMHLGHLRSHIQERIQRMNPQVQGFFSPLDWRVFIQSGAASRQSSFPVTVREPCCALRYIGGDGTGIGVQIKNLDAVQPVWKPLAAASRPKNWGAMDRCAIGNNVPLGSNRTAKDRKDARDKMKHVCSSVHLGAQADTETLEQLKSYRDLFPPEVYDLLCQWLDLNSLDKKWSSMRSLLRACACQDSLCGMIPESMLKDLRTAITLALRPVELLSNTESQKTWTATLFKLRQVGMGPQIVEALTIALQCYTSTPTGDSPVLFTLCAFLAHLGELSTKHHSLKHFCTMLDPKCLCKLAEARTSKMFDSCDIKSPDMLPPEQWVPRPNPASTGIRYNMSKHGSSVRTSWPLPEDSQKRLDTELGSCDGCKKVRWRYTGHRQRAGLWVYMCMEHEFVIGYHIMKHGEGRRDGIIPPYRFMENPPEAIFGDYVCGWEETALNLMPGFYRLVQFFHDIFHGCIHTCSERFCSRGLDQFASINTSLMEQFNSFLQPLRGLVKSGTTKVMLNDFNILK